MSGVHEVAAAGFGAKTSDLYNRVRPSYPSEAISALHAALRGKPPYNIVELGAGTGIFTRALLAHPEFKGDAVKELKAVEPSSGMRDTFSKNVHDNRVSIIDGTFDNTHVEDHWADAIVVAQAWHWCTDYDKAVIELARVLKPDGLAFFIWNHSDYERAASWMKQAQAIYARSGTDSSREGFWRKTFSEPSYIANFDEPEELAFTHEVQTSIQNALDSAKSISHVAILDDAKKEKIIDELRSIIDNAKDDEWVDKERGSVKIPFQTVAVVMKRKLKDPL